jgi:hypothetical protein
VLAEVARDQGHVVNYLAGLIAATDKSIAK